MERLIFPEIKSVSDGSIERVAEVYTTLRRNRPIRKQDLKNYVKVFLGIDIPDKRICSDHNSPVDYPWHSFSAEFAAETQANADAIIWANRSGGKTELAAIATLLDCTFKPNCQVRILGGSGEQAVLDKHKVSRNVYNKWLADKLFADEFSRRIAGAHCQSEIIIARYAPLAAAKLVQLTKSEKEETARKACLDIMSVPKVVGKKTQASTEPQSSPDKQSQQLPPQTASKLLAALAEVDRNNVKSPAE